MHSSIYVLDEKVGEVFLDECAKTFNGAIDYVTDIDTPKNELIDEISNYFTKIGLRYKIINESIYLSRKSLLKYLYKEYNRLINICLSRNKQLKTLSDKVANMVYMSNEIDTEYGLLFFSKDTGIMSLADLATLDKKSWIKINLVQEFDYHF